MVGEQGQAGAAQRGWCVGLRGEQEGVARLATLSCWRVGLTLCSIDFVFISLVMPAGHIELIPSRNLPSS